MSGNDEDFYTQLNRSVPLDHSAIAGYFNRNDIECGKRFFKLFDCCREYETHTDHVFSGLLDSSNRFAVFTVVEQKSLRGEHGLKVSNVLLITIKCDYKDHRGVLSNYLFQIRFDYNVAKYGYFYNMSVNKNGTALLFHNQYDCMVARVPTELNDVTTVTDTNGNVLYSSVVNGELLFSNRFDSVIVDGIIKLEWSAVNQNTFSIMSMESTFAASRVKADEISDLIELAPSTRDTYGVVRIFDLELSLDHPVYTLKLSEAMCRTGTDIVDSLENQADGMSPVTKGSLVDFVWNENDVSTIGSFTLFVLTNYGFIFVYCPVIINSTNNFRRKMDLMTRALTLSKDGFVIGDRGDCEIKNSKSDISRLMDCLSISKTHSSQNSLHPMVIKLVVDSTPSELSVVGKLTLFESFAILSTEPWFTVITVSYTGEILLFKDRLEIYPQTSQFKNINKLNIVRNINCVFIHTHVSHKCKRSFIPVSESLCLLYSTNETLSIKIAESMLVDVILRSVATDEYSYYYSQPIVIIEIGDNPTREKRVPSYNRMLMLSQEYCYFNRCNMLKLSSVSIVPFEAFISKRRPDTDPSMIDFNLNICNTVQPSSNTEHFGLKLPNYIASMTLEFRDTFKGLRSVFAKKCTFKEKMLEMVKFISLLDSRVLLQSDIGRGYEELISRSTSVNEEIVKRVDEFFSEDVKSYDPMLCTLKDSVTNIELVNKRILSKYSKVSLLLEQLRELQVLDDGLISISNIITNIHIKYSALLCNLICSKDCYVNNVYSHDDNVRAMTDQWLNATMKRNIDKMIFIFNRVQLLRNKIESIY